jgi:hypothetical protein
MNEMSRFALLALLAIPCVPVASRADLDPWESYRFLIGEWVGDGDGQPGRGTGEFTLKLDLKESVLVRRGVAEFPAANGQPASWHEDLMVVYREEKGKPAKAIYFDSEGHVINYAVSFSGDTKTLTFLSEPQAKAPRFRLSYKQGKAGAVAVKFEISPPGDSDAFKTYLEGNAHRKEK